MLTPIAVKRKLPTSVLSIEPVGSSAACIRKAIAFVSFILFFATAAFSQTKITGLTVSASQTGSLIYGTGASVTYTVNITSSTGSGNGSEALSFNWIGNTPTGVTLSPSSLNPKNTTTFTLTVTTSNTTSAGTYNFTITSTHTGGTATSPAPSSLVIGTKALTITGLGVSNKVYDGNTTGTLTGTATLSGVINGDNVILGGTPSATFANANIGTGKAVTVSGYTISGTGAGNYTLTQPAGFTANITAAPLTISGLAANNKTYDGTTAASFTSGSLVGVVSGDNVSFSVSGAFASKNVANNIAVSSTATLSGTSAGNYTLTQPSGLTANITQAALTITANNVSKTYGSSLTGAAGSTAFTSSGLKNSETIGTVTIAYGTGGASTDPVGTNTGTVTPSAATGGTFTASNYSITYTGGNITVNPATLTITASAASKPYNTTLTTGPASSGFTSSGLVAGETLNTVYLTYSAGYNATDAIGTTGTITPSLPVTGSATFNTSNYNISFVAGTLTVTAATFAWTGAVSSDWATPGNWSVNGVQQTTTYPGLNEATDVVQIGVSAYTNNANQPAISANLPNSIATLTFGSATTPITLNLASNITLNISGTTTLNAGSEVVNLNGASGSSLVIGGDYVNNTGATFNNNSSATITVSGVFTSSGTNNFGSALLTFNNPGNPITFTLSGTQIFTNVVFANGHYLLKKPGGPGSAKFYIASNGTLTLQGNVNLTIASATLTLLSDATGSASVAPITDNSIVSGTVGVQRYMQAQRGYRLMASPVNGGSDANGNYVYSLNYLKNSTYLTGSTGTSGLFDKAGNPTLYIYREDIIPNNSSFITGNFRGISDMLLGNNTPPTYSLNIDGSGFSIPVSNGYLFYYRGSRNQKTLAQLTVAGAAATTDTLTASGTLNTGQIIFRDWYTPSSTALGYSNPDPTLVGFNLAGNPYASSIDWETYNTSTPTSGIYAQNVSDFVYELNPVTNNYDVYEAGTGGTVFTNNATRTIVSGQGFFVLAKSTGAQLIFNESAKNTALQNTGPNLYMGRPAGLATNGKYLKLQMAMDNTNKDDIVIAFNNSAKPSFDMKEDALYKSGSGKVSLASLSSDQKLLAINYTPLSQKSVMIPLKVGATTNGTYSLNMNSIQGVPELYDIWLMDAYKQDSVDMRHNKTYLFDVIKTDTASYGAYRFKLIMRQNPALAYHLLNFTATKATGREVQVAWVAEHEANYTHFTVERSTDGGTTYDVVGGVPSTGAGKYSLLDKTPGENNLYRLKQEDINNNITYSHIIPVGFANQSNNLANSNINIYPNPASSTVYMAVNTAVKSNSTTYNFTITNSYGLVIKQGTSAQANWQANINDLLPGTYVIQVVNNKDKSFIGKSKLVKL